MSAQWGSPGTYRRVALGKVARALAADKVSLMLGALEILTKTAELNRL